MKKILIVLVFAFISLQVNAQYYRLRYDSVGIVSKLILNTVATGSSTDSVLTKKANGGVYKVARSSFGGVSNVSSANGDITVASGSTTPILTLNSGGTANQIVKRGTLGSIFTGAYSGNFIINTNGSPYKMEFNSGGVSTAGGYLFQTEAGTRRLEIFANGNVEIPILDTDGTAPTTSGTPKMVITDGTGQLSFDDIPSGGGGVTSVSAGLGMSFSTITSTGSVGADTTVLRTVANSLTLAQLQTKFDTKQATLVSGTNIKTINGTSLLGSGNISITGTQDLQSVLDNGNSAEGDLTISGTFWGGGMRLTARSLTASGTINPSDFALYYDCTGGSISQTLPTGSGYQYSIFVFKKVDASANTLFINGAIDGGSAEALVSENQSIIVQNIDGTNYKIIAKK